MLFTLLTALTATSGEDVHTTVRGRALAECRVCPLLPSALAGSGSQEEGASLTLTGGHTTGKGETHRESSQPTNTILTMFLALPLPSVANVVIDGYTHNSTLTSGDSVPLGTQLILVCRIVGLPYGTPLSYKWSNPNGDCVFIGKHCRKVYKEHILVVNTTSTGDGGTYTCQVTATGGQEANASFTLNVIGMPFTT